MIKLSLAIFSYIGLFLLSFFSAEDIMVENNTPAMLSPGTKSLVEITINKGDIQGFSKLELNLPEGFTASPAEIQGASFTFSSQKARFVWMTLPGESVFTVTYYIESAENLEGPFEIPGSFSYVKENKRIDFNIPTRTVIVKKQLEPTPEQVAETLPELKREADVVEMICERTVTKISSTEYLVNLKVNNNMIHGFGKILETLPDHCKSEKINDGGAVVTQDENTIKFVWFEVPVAEFFEVSYRIECTSPVDNPSIKGILSYTEDGNPYTIDVIQTNNVIEEPLATITNPETNIVDSSTTTNNTDQNGGDVVNNATENTTTTPPEEIKPVETEEVVAEQNPTTPPVTSIPSAETGITYKVQIMAAHRVVNKTYLQDKFSFTDQYNIENHEGWVKYTTGKYSEYKDARDARVKIIDASSKLPGPFVTAYNDGERITVQEALLISKQVWYK